jgi:hypothetical protein
MAGGLRAGVRWLATLVLLVVLLPTAGVSAQEAGRTPPRPGGELLGLGGSPGLPADAILPFRAGVADQVRFEATVQNLGDARAWLRVESTGPVGVEVALADAFVPPLEPGEQRRIPLVLRVGSTLPVGDHPVRFSLIPASSSGPTAGGASYAPGLGGRLVVRVGGAEARVRLLTRDLLADSAMSGGLLELYALEPGSPAVLLERTDEIMLERTVVPGPFRASFERPALDPSAPPVRTAVEFVLGDGADETIVLGVVGISVFTLEVEPRMDVEGGVEHADLRVALRNRLETVRRPLVLELEVRRDGELVELLELSTLLELPVGVTTTGTRYRPAGGFLPGEWAFDVRLGSGWIAVGPDAPVSFVVARSASSVSAGEWLRVAVPLIVLLVVLGAFAIGGARGPRTDRRQE